jgi:nucleobase:cation symporter-1, NCS1 family
VPLAAWAGVFAAAVVRIRSWPALDRNVVVWPLVWVGVASVIGLGLVQSSTSGLSWVGYLAPKSQLSAAGIGVLVALVVAFAGQWVTARATWSEPE